MKKKSTWTQKSAEDLIKSKGATIKDDKIFMPKDCYGEKSNPEWKEFWSAYYYLREFHPCRCDYDDLLAFSY